MNVNLKAEHIFSAAPLGWERYHSALRAGLLKATGVTASTWNSKAPAKRVASLVRRWHPWRATLASFKADAGVLGPPGWRPFDET
jgi:hypothetical protein